MNGSVYISGATGGLGKCMATECASRGWDLVLTDMGEQKLGVLAAALQNAYGVRVDAIACDLADVNARTKLIDRMRRRGIRLHMAINVAGLDHEGLFLERSREEILTILNVNVVSTVDMMHSLMEFRVPDAPFRLINVCSLAGMFPMPVKATYAATKRMLISMSLALREEYREKNATVTALCPAGMATNELLLKSLESQGVAGLLTTVQVPAVASCAVDCALKGRAVCVPGVLNRLLYALGKAVPATLVARIIRSHWTKTNGRLKQKLAKA
jgi:short-subunit dehydrogenase